MEKLLKPDKLDIEPGTTNADKTWLHWKMTFDNFIATYVGERALTDEQKLATLTNCISANVYSYISSSANFDAALNTLKDIYVKPKNEVYVRHCLATRKQQEGETVDQFMHALDVLSKECTFINVDANAYRDEYVRDSFIRGIQSAEIRQRLLEECGDRKTTFTKARTLELASINSQQINDKPYLASIPVQHHEPMFQDNHSNFSEPFCAAVTSNHSSSNFSNYARPGRNNSCLYCGNQNHPRNSCPARDVTCHKCQKTGHFQKVCRSSSNRRIPSNNASRNNHTSASMIPTSLSDAIIDSKVNDNIVKTLFDSGSSSSFIDSKVVKKLKLEINYTSQQSISMASTSCNTKTIGSVTVNLSFAGSSHTQVRLQVMENLCCETIIGHDILSLHEKLVINFGGENSPIVVDNVGNSAFSCTLTAADVEPPKLFEHLYSDSIKPVACKSRRFSPSDQKFIDSKVQGLLADGIIEPSSSPWRAQVLVTNNDRHRRRLVVDYSLTINKFTKLDAYPLPNIDDMAQKVAQFSVYSSFDLKSAYHQIPLRDPDKPFTAFEAAGRLYQFTRIPFGVTNGVASFQRTVDKIIEKEGVNCCFAYLDNITVAGTDKAHHDSNVTKLKELVLQKYGFTLNEDKTIASVTEIKMLGYLISKGQIKPDPDRMEPCRMIKYR